MNRVVRAARLHLISPQALLIPAAVLAAAMVINLGIFALLRQNDASSSEASFTGGLASLYIAVMTVFIQAMNRQFDVALSFGLPRRLYLLGTGLFALGLSLCWGLVLALLRLVETSTDGWGVRMDFFAVAGMDTGGLVSGTLVYAVPMLALAALGVLIGGIFARWGQIGVYTAGLALLVGVGAAIVTVSYTWSWTDGWQWLSDRSLIALTAGYPWLLVAVCGGAAFWVVRGSQA